MCAKDRQRVTPNISARDRGEARDESPSTGPERCSRCSKRQGCAGTRRRDDTLDSSELDVHVERGWKGGEGAAQSLPSYVRGADSAKGRRRINRRVPPVVSIDIPAAGPFRERMTEPMMLSATPRPQGDRRLVFLRNLARCVMHVITNSRPMKPP